MEKILEVKDLHISFRTNNGTVKAVRGINFTLNKGETLAVVGESGSGKSVTARAVMGILAGNAIVESGEIFYDGKDLLRIPEDDFHQLRGNKVSMIFQDPFSSLNPIMKIGQQLTEAMILNGKANQRDAKRSYDKLVGLLEKRMMDALDDKGDAIAKEQIEILKKSTAKSAELEGAYNNARGWIEMLIVNIDGAHIDVLNGDPKQISKDIKEIIKGAPNAAHDYLVSDKAALDAAIAKLTTANDAYVKEGDKDGVRAALEALKAVLTPALELATPDYFAMGYYVSYAQNPDMSGSIETLNNRMRTYLEEKYLRAFLTNVMAAIQYSESKSNVEKDAAARVLGAKLPLFQNNSHSASELRAAAKEMIAAVEKSVDELAIVKDSFACTFRSSMDSTLDAYLRLRGLQDKKRLSKKERELKENSDLDRVRGNVERVITRLYEAYSNRAVSTQDDYRRTASDMVAHIAALASKMAYKVTNQIAKKHAIDLMQEVGIPEPRKRFSQYPFEFSGGMRQRIVIAIALSANPDILICDEPTTALDVTIQAQILDLINKLKEERGLSVIFITHDLGVVANMADHIAVMYAGKIVELGTVDEVFYEPAHPYTWALLASMPDLDTKEKLGAIPGTPPNMINPPVGDAFAARNQYAMQIDFEKQPPMFEITPTHSAATWLLHPDAPKAEPPKIVTDRIKRMRERMEVSGND